MIISELVENEDGSADMKVSLSEEEVQVLVQFALNEAIKNYIKGTEAVVVNALV